MVYKKPSRKVLRTLGAQPQSEDGVNPRDWHKLDGSERGQKGSRKVWQLCHQVGETVGQILAGECGDDLLRDLYVVSVEPAPDATRLLVTVRIDRPIESVDPNLIMARLEGASGLIRDEVASAITRKRTPKLTFRLALLGANPSPSEPESVQPE